MEVFDPPYSPDPVPGEETLGGSVYLKVLFGAFLYVLWLLVVRKGLRWYQVRTQDESLGVSREDSVSEGDN